MGEVGEFSDFNKLYKSLHLVVQNMLFQRKNKLHEFKIIQNADLRIVFK